MVKKIIYRVLRAIYRRLKYFSFVRKLRLKYKSYKEKRAKQRLVRYKAKIEAGFKSADFSKISVKKITSSISHTNCLFKFDVLGQMTHLNRINFDSCIKGLNNVINQEDKDVDVRISVISTKERKDNEQIVKKLEEQLSVYVLSPGEAILVSRKGFKAMFFAFDYDPVNELKDIKVSEQDATMLAYAKKEKVNYIGAYGLRKNDGRLQLSKKEEVYERLLANLGCRYIFSSNDKGLYKGGNIKKIDGGFTYAFVSTGETFGLNYSKDQGGIQGGAVLRTRINPLKKKTRYSSITGFLPYYSKGIGEKCANIFPIDYKDTSQMKNAYVLDTLRNIENSMGNLKENRNIITVKEICDIIDAKIPEEYMYLANIPVGKVCSRSFEVEPWDVFFFLPQFRDVNDGELQLWKVRKRIVERAVDRGVMFVVSYRKLDPSIPHMVVKNSREAHIKVCAEFRKRYNITTVGITGSVGKTSTKDMMYEVLREKYCTYKNLRNTNVQVNIGLHVQEFRGGQEFFIQEIGGGRPGGASRHSRMILPEVCVITNIGWAHIGNYGTQEKILEGKLGIVDGLKPGGTLYVNWDDPLLAKVDKKRLSVISNAQDDLDRAIFKKIKNINVVSYGVHNHNADYYADNIVEKDGVTHFNIVDGNKGVKATLNVRGEYNVLNAVCCYAVGKKYNISDKKIIEGISNFRTSGVRQNLISVGGYQLFVDCFNSSPPSVASSLAVLDAIKTDGKKIAVIGDITGADDLVEKVHKEVAEIVKGHNPDVVVCYGESSKIVYDNIKESFEQVYSFTNKNKLEDYLKTQVNVGDVVLFKGSSKMLLSERIDEVFGTMLSDQGYIDSVKFREYRQGAIYYYIYKSYVTLTKAQTKDATIKIPNQITGLPVYNLGDESFAEMDSVVNVVIPEGIRHIGESCFSGCTNLKSIKFPKSLLNIDAGAFRKCNSLSNVIFHDGIIHIGAGTFKQCKNLERIVLPSSITEIDTDAFSGCKKLVAQCPKGSYAENYCIENKIKYTVR